MFIFRSLGACSPIMSRDHVFERDSNENVFEILNPFHKLLRYKWSYVCCPISFLVTIYIYNFEVDYKSHRTRLIRNINYFNWMQLAK